MRAAVSIGLIGTTDVSALRALAPRIEQLGFRTLWLNDVPRGDSLAGLRAAAEVTTTLALATGVIPLDRRPANTFDLAGLPADRLTLGIGSGGAAKPVTLVRDGVATLRAETDASIVVGALGPRMRRLGATDADGVLLNWLTPDTAGAATADLRSDSGARPARSILYVRTIVDESARAALESEAARYEHVPAYAANFDRLGMRPMDATIDDAETLDAYRDVIDEVVLRAITPNGTVDELEEFVERASGWAR